MNPVLESVVENSRTAYAARMARPSAAQWWTVVVLTASSDRQADRYRTEIERRLDGGRLPSGVQYLVVPDMAGRRMGSGGATIQALGALTESVREPLLQWWERNRVFMIHSGGDSRRLPQYSPSGKLFGALPLRTPWGDTSTVFDEMMALSTAWVEKMPAGLLVASGDVVLKFDAAQVNWSHPGVTGVAMRQPVETGSQHGVYVIDERGRVYTFLQKPSAAEVTAAGGMLEDNHVALDSGLIRFDPAIAARLTTLGAFEPVPPLDLYEHITKALTGQWDPASQSGVFFSELATALRNVPFQCSLVDGEFTHIGTTRSFRTIASGAGVIDSVIGGPAELGKDSVVIECNLCGTVRVGRGAMLHGVTGITGPIEVPENTVVHEIPVRLEHGCAGYVIRVYGVEDNPKTAAGAGTVTWFGRPIFEVLAGLGIEPADVWPGINQNEWSLWNARLFPAGTLDMAWQCARWMLGYTSEHTVERWRTSERLSLAESTRWADQKALAEARRQRAEAAWARAALELAAAGSDIRPLLANPPSVSALAGVGRELSARADRLALTEAASQYIHASTFLMRSGMIAEADSAEAAAFACVERAVREGAPAAVTHDTGRWHFDSVTVSAPPRIDLGGGWSDTPPFCLDWGGTVLNIALELNGDYPIQSAIRRLDDPIIRCISEETDETAEFTNVADLLATPYPGSPFAVACTALYMTGIVDPTASLDDALLRRGGGLEIRTRVRLPIGSGLGTSSILGATVLRAIAEMSGVAMTDQQLSDQVMRLEQLMTTGGGWQDQAGGIFPGVKLLVTGPGLRQRIRVQPIEWSNQRRQEFSERLVLYYTGIQRIAKNLLKQVVRSYLAREVATVQVLHSIKTLATEMAYAMRDGEWKYLGELLDRHWRLNKILDPNTTNAPINAILNEVRPYIDGAKLAGAGGGGFLILLASDAERARALREKLGAGVYSFRIAEHGLRIAGR